MIEKAYQPNEVEDRIYRAWEAAHAFDSGRPERAKAEPYCIVIPPPNVTGSLHMGHALNNTLQDILCRFERMRGKDVLWQVGTDHAGIATQMVVERQLMERQEPDRRKMGREAFIKRVWEWKEESGGTIIRQLKKLGASCDWRRERFTMDEGLSRAVLRVFVDLYKEGLIYKDKRLVNWDPKLLTAISDLEVQQVETRGHLWYLRYPLEGKTFNPDDPSTFIVVATTRPETMLGDTAVAVNPEDERYKEFVEKFRSGNPAKAILPLVGRPIRIIADEYSDPEKGSGAVKITPAHDFNDFEIGQKHDLRLINIFDPEARLVLRKNNEFLAVAGGADLEEVLALDGQDRFKARKAIVELLEARELVEKIEPNLHTVPHGDRSGVVLEPRLTDQWYVDAKKLAVDALDAVKNGRTTFIPKNWEKTYFDWLENIRPWCISRQLWWGHRIPAWYGPDWKQGIGVSFNPPFYDQAAPLRYFVAETEEKALELATTEYGGKVRIAESAREYFDNPGKYQGDFAIWRDEDVLDTWFSSALWPFSTLGWPDATPELKRYYPTQVLVTGFDIIFFWVARMMMMGLHFMKEVPFRHVYIHALVRDASGAKMSKSKGNVIDPLSIIDDYGADALRFTLAAMAAQGRDIKLSANRVEGYRNFATKLWNAARFGEVNGCKRVAGFDPKQARETLNRWILGEAAKAAREVTAAIEAYRFNEAAGAAYRFVWSIYCDWYIELAKPVLTGADSPAKDETRATSSFVLDEILKLLHPFMPFLTEELWRVTGEAGPKRETMLVLAEWPKLSGLADEKAEAEIGWLIDIVNAIRSVRAELNIASERFPVFVQAGNEQTFERVKRWREPLLRLARLSDISAVRGPQRNWWRNALRYFYDAWWRPNDFWTWQTVKIPTLQGAVQVIVRGEIVLLPLGGVIDIAAERARLEKELAKIADDVAHIDKKLGNADFMARAPEEVVDEQREKREEAQGRAAKVREALERLKGAA